MFIFHLSGFVAALSVFLSSQTSPVTALPAQNTTSSRLENMGSFSAANTIFALNLFKKLSANDPSNNLFFSPLSISSALLIVSLGARNNTETQMLKSFIESTQRFYHSGLKKLNFKQGSEDSRRHINAWVEEKTSGKIQDLLVPGVIDSLTKLVLVNAIYFKGNWADKFNKDYTMNKPFWISKNERKTVQMMFRKGEYNMAHISAYRTSVLEIPYVDNEMSMIILLPDEIEDNSTGLEKLEREITYEKFMDWINPKKMFSREIDLSLPKFKLEEKYDLKPVLRSMGMTDAFDEGKADFSGMSTNNDLVISEVVHKSYIEVNEEGTEAAAATGIITELSGTSLPFEFKADYPFAFFVIDRSTNSILFLGRFSSP